MAKKKKNTDISVGNLPIVAVDLGSSSVRAIAAYRVADDMFRILGMEESQKFPCVEKGVVVNTSNAGYMVNEVLRLLSNHIPGVAELPAAFVTMGGRYMLIHPTYARRDQARPKIVSEELYENMEHECRTKLEDKNPGAAVIGLIPRYYKVDGVEQEDKPDNLTRVTFIDAHYTAFVMKKENVLSMRKTFDQAGKSIENTFVRQDALLSVFAAADGSEVLQRGCAVIDFGAQTTTLSIYKNNNYLATKVVAQGGYDITRTLEAQGIPFDRAEKLKCQYGYASPEFVPKRLTMTVLAPALEGGKWHTSNTDVARLIAIKLNEILGPILELLRKEEDRISVVYITGGASMLNGLQEFLQQRVRAKVLYGAHDRLLTRDTDDKYLEPKYASLVGALLLGAEYRDKHPNQMLTKPKFKEEVIQTMIDLFKAP